MQEHQIVTASERQRFEELNERLDPVSMPEFLNHDEAVVSYWDLLGERFPEYQFLLLEKATGKPVGRGHSIPLRFDKDWSRLPDGGLDWALEKGFLDHEAGREPNIQSALFIVISRDHLGAGLSYRMLAAMRHMGHRQGLAHLIAPVRPSSKSQYPLIPMAEYCKWKRADGFPFDPWIRVHVKAGGTILRPCQEAMLVRGTVDQWTDWTDVVFPGDGRYLVPGGLVPVRVNRAANQGSYVEPGVWILHETAPLEEVDKK